MRQSSWRCVRLGPSSRRSTDATQLVEALQREDERSSRFLQRLLAAVCAAMSVTKAVQAVALPGGLVPISALALWLPPAALRLSELLSAALFLLAAAPLWGGGGLASVDPRLAPLASLLCLAGALGSALLQPGALDWPTAWVALGWLWGLNAAAALAALYSRRLTSATAAEVGPSLSSTFSFLTAIRRRSAS